MMKPGLPRASWNGLTLLEGLQPPAEQKEVSRAESLLLAEEWQEFSDPDSLRKQEQDHSSWLSLWRKSHGVDLKSQLT